MVALVSQFMNINLSEKTRSAPEKVSNKTAAGQLSTRVSQFGLALMMYRQESKRPEVALLTIISADKQTVI